MKKREKIIIPEKIRKRIFVPKKLLRLLVGEEKRGRGAPSKYMKEYDRIAEKACAELGAKDKDLSRLFGVSEDRIWHWCRKHEDFHKSIKRGRDWYDNRQVERSLLQRAMGFTVPETRTEELLVKVQGKDGKFKRVPGKKVTTTEKYYVSDPSCLFFWLQNRNNERWRNTKFLQISGKVDHTARHKIRMSQLKQLPIEDLEKLLPVLAALQYKPDGDIPETTDGQTIH